MASTKRAKVIAITGQAGSGKDTMFALLKGMLPKLDVIRVAFGDEVKREYAEHLDVDLDEMLLNKNGHRLGLQKWGTEHRREEDRNYWINKIRPQVDFLMETADVVVVTDVRFINEAEFLKKEYDATVVRIVGSANRVLYSLHESEVEMLNIKVDWLVPNKGTLSELASGVRFILQENGLEYEQ